MVNCSQRGDDGVFRDCVLVPNQSPVRKVARTLALSMGIGVSEDGTLRVPLTPSPLTSFTSTLSLFPFTPPSLSGFLSPLGT